MEEKMKKRIVVSCILSAAVLVLWAQTPYMGPLVPVYDRSFRGGAYYYLKAGPGLVVNRTGCTVTQAECGTIDAAPAAAPQVQLAQEAFKVVAVPVTPITLGYTPLGGVLMTGRGHKLLAGTEYTVTGRAVTLVYANDWSVGDTLLAEYIR